MPEPMLDIRELACGYGDLPVLRGIDMSVAAGEMVGIIGPNGCGKTTLLRAATGVLP
ncbi:MAG: ABC transporter ATP-binding protein, partial [Bradyrhizobium sp.]|nr:ABC transporter ATP-binding protein [Bradyrhizobium sp.]